MKKIALTLTIVILLALTITTIASAALPGTGWWSAVYTQNIGANDGTLTMNAYQTGDPQSYGSSSFLFDYGQALVYDPGKSPDYDSGNVIGFSSALPSQFEGSLVLSASVEVASLSQIANFNNGPVGGGGRASAYYQGFSADMAATELRIPTIKHNYASQSTTIYVQAAGSAAEVTITYNMNDGSVYTKSASIAQNEMVVFEPSNTDQGPIPSDNEICGYDPNISPCFGAATIISDTPIAASYVEHAHVGAPAQFALSTRALTPGDEAYKLYAPNIKHTYRMSRTAYGITGDAIMNVGDSDALVQISLTVTKLGLNAPGGVQVGDTFTDTEVIKPGKSVVFSKYDSNLGGMPQGTYAAAVFESLDTAEYDPQPLVGSSNDTKFMSILHGKTVYNLFADTNTTSKVAVPMVTEFVDALTGGLTVQNVGDQPDRIYFDYYEYGTDNVYRFWTVDTYSPGEAVNNWGISMNYGNYFANDGTWDWAVLDGKKFSAIVWSESGEEIICLGFELPNSDNYDISNYEAFNITP